MLTRDERRAAYALKLKDPRWQKKRLEIFDRDAWMCQECRSAEITLNVHHLYYDSDNEPWEYDNSALITLCEQCHERETAERYQEERRLIDGLRRRGWMSSEFQFVADALLQAAPSPLSREAADRSAGVVADILTNDEFSAAAVELNADFYMTCGWTSDLDAARWTRAPRSAE